jgi:hypothetical protein
MEMNKIRPWQPAEGQRFEIQDSRLGEKEEKRISPQSCRGQALLPESPAMGKIVSQRRATSLTTSFLGTAMD